MRAGEHDMGAAVRELKALADMNRLRTAALLAYAGSELCVCELVDALRESQYNVSRYLGALCAAGLIRKTKRGRWAMYSLATGRGPLAGYIGRLVRPRPCCGVIAADIARLEGRLALRRKGVCVVGGGC
ncbi:MAG: metalloregulator ArsR/SmtB family transcription factor [Elusimicrobiales bacterium]|nr:metalloregulator ArsR/SmtB family transcription factor [Elusimicrobiales bacterium]